jgi:hypothetical protein
MRLTLRTTIMADVLVVGGLSAATSPTDAGCGGMRSGIPAASEPSSGQRRSGVGLADQVEVLHD